MSTNSFEILKREELAALSGSELVKAAEKVEAHLRAAIRETRDRIIELIGGGVFTAEMSKLQEAVLNQTDVLLDEIKVRQEENAYFITGEFGFQAAVQANPSRFDPEAVKNYMEQQRRLREEANAPLRKMGDVVIALQKDLVFAFEVRTEGQKEEQKKELSEGELVVPLRAMVEAFAQVKKRQPELPDITENDLNNFVFDGDSEGKVTGKINNYRDADIHKRRLAEIAALIHANKITNASSLGEKFAYAVTATKFDADLSGTKWLDTIRAKIAADKERGGGKIKPFMLNLNLDTGSHYFIHFDEDGEGRIMSASFSEGYKKFVKKPDGTDLAVSEILEAEQDPENLSLPNAGVIYAHVYESDEITQALKDLPANSDIEVQCQLIIDGEYKKAVLKKNGAGLEYKEKPDVTDDKLPDLKDIHALPGIMRPTRLRFKVPEHNHAGQAA